MAKEKNEVTEYGYIRKSFTYDGERYFVRGKTEEEAIAAKIELKRKLENGEAVKQHNNSRHELIMTGDTLVKDFAKVWLDNYIKPKVRPAGAAKQKGTMTEKSFEMYTQKLDRFILPAIGNMKLKRVKDINLQAILNDMKQSGLASSTCNKVKIVLNAMFSQAVKSRLITFNPADNLCVTAEAKGQRRSLTSDERAVLLQIAKTHRCGAWIKFLLYTGLRPAESAALQVSDIDFANSVIHITKAIESGTECVVGEPKTKASIRDVPITSAIRDDLKAAIKGKAPAAFVFPQTDGKTMMTTTAMSNNWRSFSRQMDLAMGAETTAHGHIYDKSDVDKNGVALYPDKNGLPKDGHKIAPDLVLYCLRHTYCTDLQKAGVPLNIAKYLMGHSDIAVTASIYTHTGTSEAVEAGRIIDMYDLGKTAEK